MKVMLLVLVMVAVTLHLVHTHALPPSMHELGDIVSNSSHLVARVWVDPQPASDADWARFIARGCTMNNMMRVDDAAAGALFTPQRPSAASRFGYNFIQEMLDWGYHASEVTDGCRMDNAGYGISTALRGLGFSVEDNQWICWKVSHGNYEPPPNVPSIEQQTYMGPDGRVRRVTGGYYVNALSRLQGVIVAHSAYGANYMAGRRNPPVPAGDIPEMYLTSDITWGIWSQEAWEPRYYQNLKWVIIWSVLNAPTQAVIRRVYGGTPGHWPGKWIWAGSDEGKAILGTPIGTSAAYTLIQHKYHLGNKVIGRIGIFMQDFLSLADVCMAFEIVDAPPPE